MAPGLELIRPLLAVRRAEVLAYLASNDVLHRDVKPGNIMLAANHRVVLTDFGLFLPEGLVGLLRRVGNRLQSWPRARKEPLA